MKVFACFFANNKYLSPPEIAFKNETDAIEWQANNGIYADYVEIEVK